jgi:hypothetical protein
MDKHAEDPLVTGYEDLIEGLHLPDPDDRHVLAAAIRGRADVIVTRNIRHFQTLPCVRLALRRNTRMSSSCISSTSRRGSLSRRRGGTGRA